MKWHLSKQGNILAVTPESEDVCVCVCGTACVLTGCWVDVLGCAGDKQTDRKLILQSGSPRVMLFIPSAGELVRNKRFCAAKHLDAHGTPPSLSP